MTGPLAHLTDEDRRRIAETLACLMALLWIADREDVITTAELNRAIGDVAHDVAVALIKLGEANEGDPFLERVHALALRRVTPEPKGRG